MAIAMDTVAEPAVIPDLPQLEARLGERLLADRKLSPPDLDRAQGVQQTMGGRLSQLLVDLGLVSEVDVAQALAQVWPQAQRQWELRMAAMAAIGAFRLAVDTWRDSPQQSLFALAQQSFAQLQQLLAPEPTALLKK